MLSVKGVKVPSVKGCESAVGQGAKMLSVKG